METVRQYVDGDEDSIAPSDLDKDWSWVTPEMDPDTRGLR